MTAEPSRTRRSLLVGGASGLGGVLALPLLAAPADAVSGQRSTSLTGSGFTVVHGDLARPDAGERALVSGALHDRTGARIGTMHAEVSVLRAVNRHDVSPAAIETHTFVMTHGTLVGHGVADHAGSGTFAVVGGTGDYSAVRGSYVVTQHRHGQGGDGSATFSLTLSTDH